MLMPELFAAEFPEAVFAPLSRRQVSFLAALLSASSIHEAATQAKVGYTTARRWLQTDTFGRAYTCARKQIVVHALAQIELTAPEAVETLKRLLKDANPYVQVAAAKAMMDMAMKATTFADHEQRLHALEEGEHASDLRVA